VEESSTQSVRNAPRIPESPPVVTPMAQDIKRPLWSVMIPVYNCTGYLAETLNSVLRQDPGEKLMQIEVIDDGSTDADVDELVRAIGKGRIAYFRQSENVGSLRNFHTCIERARGHLVHILHGDDLAGSGFYSVMQALFEGHPGIGAGFCRYSYIDENGRTLFHQQPEMDRAGVLENWLEQISERQRIQYVAMVVKREVYEHLGGFYGVEYGEDWEMWVRIASRYLIGYVPGILAQYRRHFASISGKSFLTGKNMAELGFVMKKIQDYLPAGKRTRILHLSRRFYAHYAMRIANTLWKNFKHKRGASAQALAAWSMSKDVGLLLKIIKLYTRITLNI
jgi:glycosyltransferase involved in cell wall biosynthesis